MVRLNGVLWDPDPQLMWGNLLVICASLLLALCLLTLAVGWWQHFSWPVVLRTLLLLASSVAAAVAAHHLYGTYAFWATFLDGMARPGSKFGPLVLLGNELDHDNQVATMFGWIGVVMTGILLATGTLVIRRLVTPCRYARRTW